MWHFVAQQARFFTGGSGGCPPENRPLGAIAPPLVYESLRVFHLQLGVRLVDMQDVADAEKGQARQRREGHG